MLFVVKRAADEVSSEAKKPRIEVRSFRVFHLSPVLLRQTESDVVLICAKEPKKYIWTAFTCSVNLYCFCWFHL